MICTVFSYLRGFCFQVGDTVFKRKQVGARECDVCDTANIGGVIFEEEFDVVGFEETRILLLVNKRKGEV